MSASGANGLDAWPAAEANVIGALLLGAPYPEVARILRAEHFSGPDASLIFRAIAALASNGTVTDPQTVAELLTQTGHLQAAGGLAALSELARSTISAENVVAHARIVRDHADASRLKQLAQAEDGAELLEAVQRLAAGRAAITAAAAAAREPVELRSFTAAEILAPIEPERFLLPGVPAEAYTLIAGALSSFKTTLLVYLIVWKATGWDILGLDDRGAGTDIGRCVLASYEDTDKRILAKLQQVIQHGHRLIRERHGQRDADEFIERAVANIRRIPLMGKPEHGIVCRSEGIIIPNREFLDAFLKEVRAFAPDGALIGLDPLRLAISGSQNDDDGADIAVHSMNYTATAISGSGLVVCSHATKAGAQEPADGYAGAAYSTAGSALYSQHARSNFLMARLKEKEVHELFDPAQLGDSAPQQQLVARLTHGRLSHGAERAPAYILMRGGILERIAPKADQNAPDLIRSSGPHLLAAMERLKSAGTRASLTALEADSALRTAPRSRSR